jgi:ABC-2 type transport system ATP-binding protein
MNIVIEINHLFKKFGSTVALNDVTFSVAKGQVFGYLGPNGAGKTTTIRIMVGLLKPDSGLVRLLGEDPYDDNPKSLEARNKIGVVLESPGHFFYATVYRNLVYHARIHRLGNVEERVSHLLKQFDLWERRNDLVNTLSKGMMQKLAIARSLLHDPEVLIFDEPTAGLDPNAQFEIRNLIREFAKSGKTVFLSSHNLSEVQEICSHVAIINKGSIVAWDELKKLRETYAKPVVYVTFPSEAAKNSENLRKICENIKELRFVKNCEIEGEALRVELEDFRFSYKLNEFLVKKKLPVLELRKVTYSLEDLYSSVVKKSG